MPIQSWMQVTPTHVDVDAGGDEALISSAVHELCNKLRANDQRVLRHSSTFVPSNYIRDHSEAECIAVFQALKENTSVKHIDFRMLFEQHKTERSALAVAEYVESSKTLQTLHLNDSSTHYSHEVGEAISLLLRALSRNTSVTTLSIDTAGVKFASVAFKELLTRTQTLRNLRISGFAYNIFHEVQIAAIASGFANNTTLCDVEFRSWPEADLTPVLTALQCHPALKVIQFSGKVYGEDLPSLSGLEMLLRSQDSKVKELVLAQVETRTVGLHPVMRELGRNTTVTSLSIYDSDLNLEIAPALYRNTSIKTLDLADNGLDDIESPNVLRELLCRNKTITILYLNDTAFGLNAAATRSIFEGVRNNPVLQQLDLRLCELGDQGISILANALAIRNASTLELDLCSNDITSMGVRALVDDNVEAVKTLAKLCLKHNTIGSEGATILADALGRNAMPILKQLDLSYCAIDDDGFVAMVSALEQNTSLQILKLQGNDFGERGFIALAESLPNIKGLQEINFNVNASFLSNSPLLLEGFRKNISLVKVNIDIATCENMELSQELTFLGQRNRFTPLLKASDPPDTSPQLGIWSRALARVATEPDVLFHVLRNKPKLVGSAAGGSKKRKRDD
jgi:Ran GTPase-activating protein (RanGAP) involved in mRNA processing and transport